MYSNNIQKEKLRFKSELLQALDENSLDYEALLYGGRIYPFNGSIAHLSVSCEYLGLESGNTLVIYTICKTLDYFHTGIGHPRMELRLNEWPRHKESNPPKLFGEREKWYFSRDISRVLNSIRFMRVAQKKMAGIAAATEEILAYLLILKGCDIQYFRVQLGELSALVAIPLRGGDIVSFQVSTSPGDSLLRVRLQNFYGTQGGIRHSRYRRYAGMYGGHVRIIHRSQPQHHFSLLDLYRIAYTGADDLALFLSDLVLHIEKGEDFLPRTMI